MNNIFKALGDMATDKDLRDRLEDTLKEQALIMAALTSAKERSAPREALDYYIEEMGVTTAKLVDYFGMECAGCYVPQFLRKQAE